MGAIRPPKQAVLFAGLLSAAPDLLKLARRRLEEIFGPVSFASDVWPFDATDYYEAELGTDVRRQFVFFDELVSVERLAEIKRATNVLEEGVCDDLSRPRNQRAVNIDPGYVTLSKVVLATTKDYSHRLYLGRGIYAEVTLHFEGGAWKPWPWTYADYAGGTYHAAFVRAREMLKRRLRDGV